MSKPYRTCPHCGAHLDCGEICDCRQTADNENERQERREAAGRAERNRTEPALMAAV